MKLTLFEKADRPEFHGAKKLYDGCIRGDPRNLLPQQELTSANLRICDTHARALTIHGEIPYQIPHTEKNASVDQIQQEASAAVTVLEVGAGFRYLSDL